MSGWAFPENWRKGMRPQGKNGNEKANIGAQGADRIGGGNGNHGQVAARRSWPTHGSGSNGQSPTGPSNGAADPVPGDDDLDARILCMEKPVGAAFYRSILREYGRVNQPRLIRDVVIKRKVLQMLESVARGIDRLEAVTKRLDPKTVEALLTKLQAPPLGEVSDIKTLQQVVLGLEALAGSTQHHASFGGQRQQLLGGEPGFPE